MKKCILFSILLTIFNFGFSANAQSSKSMQSLKKQIIEELAKQKGTFAVAFKNLSNGKELLINEHENFHAASTMKTPVMIEVFKQAARGKCRIRSLRSSCQDRCRRDCDRRLRA